MFIDGEVFFYPSRGPYGSEVIDGKPDGKGIRFYPDENWYKCDFIYDMMPIPTPNDEGVRLSGHKDNFIQGTPHGRGTIIHPDGTGYDGEFYDGLPNGRGTRFHSDGERYEGDF